MTCSLPRRPGVTALALGLVFVASASAQETVVRGRVVGPDNTPIAIGRVVLHRVDHAGGATVAEAPSGADGRFELTAPASSDTAAVYFVAVRYEGELYIGQPFRAAIQGMPEQVLQVGVQATSASALLANVDGGPPPNGRTRSSGNTLLLVIPLVLAAAAVLYFVLPRRRVAPDRALLIRIAEIDERLPEAPHGQRDALREERTRLLQQLRSG